LGLFVYFLGAQDSWESVLCCFSEIGQLLLTLKSKDEPQSTQRTTQRNSKKVIMEREKLFRQILDCAFKVHSALGPGLLESAYEECLFYELMENGMRIKKQKPMPLIYNKVKLDVGYRIDLLVEDCIIIEVKSVETLADIHLAQTLTYMKLAECKLGLLVNFNVTHLKNGIKRVIL